MGDFDNTEATQDNSASQVNSNIISQTLNNNSDVSTEEINAQKQQLDDAKIEEQQQEEGKQLATKLKTVNSFFNPINYVTPASSDKLTNQDFYPTLNQPLVHGNTGGKYSVNLFSSQVLAPMAVIDSRRRALEAQEYAKQVNAQKATQRLLSYNVSTAPPQFQRELQDRAMLRIQEWRQKYKGNDQALLNDMDFQREMKSIDNGGKALYDIHSRMLQAQSDAKKLGRTLSPEQMREYDQFFKATGEFDVQHTIDGLINGTLEPHKMIGKLTAYDAMNSFSNMTNLARFKKTISDEQFRGAAKGTYSKTLKVGLTHTFLDKNAYMEGLKGAVKDLDIYESGNPDAPVGTAEHNQWLKFSQRQWESDEKAFYNKAEKQDLVENGMAEANRLAWDKAKYEMDSKSFYQKLATEVTDNHKINVANITNQYSDPKQAKEAVRQYYIKNGIQTNDVLALPTVTVPIKDKTMGVASNQLRVQVYSKDKKSWKLLSPYDIVSGNYDKKNYDIPKHVHEAAKYAQDHGTVLFNKDYEGATNMYMTTGGLTSPYQLKNGEKVDPNKITSTLISRGGINIGNTKNPNYTPTNGQPEFLNTPSQASFFVFNQNNIANQHAALSTLNKGADASIKNVNE
jgi:hypothetical protein